MKPLYNSFLVNTLLGSILSYTITFIPYINLLQGVNLQGYKCSYINKFLNINTY